MVGNTLHEAFVGMHLLAIVPMYKDNSTSSVCIFKAPEVPVEPVVPR